MVKKLRKNCVSNSGKERVLHIVQQNKNNLFVFSRRMNCPPSLYKFLLNDGGNEFIFCIIAEWKFPTGSNKLCTLFRDRNRGDGRDDAEMLMNRMQINYSAGREPEEDECANPRQPSLSIAAGRERDNLGTRNDWLNGDWQWVNDCLWRRRR